MTRGGALALGGEHVAVAAGDGVVRLFRVGTLAYRGTLPRPVRVGGHDEPETLDEVCETSPPSGVSFPDAIACAFDTDGTALTVAYSDRSVFVWDTKNVANVRRLRVFFAHSGSVFGECLFIYFRIGTLTDDVFCLQARVLCRSRRRIRRRHVARSRRAARTEASGCGTSGGRNRATRGASRVTRRSEAI